VNRQLRDRETVGVIDGAMAGLATGEASRIGSIGTQSAANRSAMPCCIPDL